MQISSSALLALLLGEKSLTKYPKRLELYRPIKETPLGTSVTVLATRELTINVTNGSCKSRKRVSLRRFNQAVRVEIECDMIPPGMATNRYNLGNDDRCVSEDQGF